MRARRFLVLPLLGQLAAASNPPVAAAAAAGLLPETALPPVIPGVFLVEFAHGRESREGFFGALAAADMAAEPRLDLAYSLFQGVSFRLTNASADPDTAAARIAGLAQVKKVWPVRLRPMPRDEVVWVGGARTAATAGAPRKRPSSASDPDTTTTTTTTFPPHVMTQVDRLRAAGYTGRGLRVAVIDSGVDYTHPALGGGCFGRPECPVAYGRDLVGDAFTGRNAPVPGADPMDCAGHGTHVTGILAARANALGFTGAAPGVAVGMYKVFGCAGGSSDDVLVAAYQQAYEDGSDIITASVSGASGWSEDPWAVAVERIVAAGVPCTGAAGNDGASGLFYPSAAANGRGVTAVASVDNAEIPQVLVGGTYRVVAAANGSSSAAPARAFGWAAGNPAFGNLTLPLWAVSNTTDVEDDACNPLPADTPDLAGYVALVNQGTCAYYLKAQNVADKGAKYMMVISNVPGETSLVYAADVEEMQGTGMVTDTQGAEWVSLLREGQRVVVEMTEPDAAPDVLVSTPNTDTAGLPSVYTSWGPTWEVDLKPQLATPGGEILSTFPLARGGFAVLSGTSMACPLAAAIYALVAEARGTTDPALLERVLSATAKPSRWAGDPGAGLAPVAQQGAGLAQAYDAAHVTTLLSVPSLSFNDTDNFVASAHFSIQNLGAQEVTYEVGHAPALTMYTFTGNSEYPSAYPNPVAEGHAELGFSATKVTVPAGGSADITVVPTAPLGLDASRLPVYGGYITINATSGGSDALSIPYLGVVGSMHSAPKVLATGWVFLSNYTDPSLTRALPNATWVVPYPTNLTDPTKIGGGGVAYPAVLVQLNVGTPLLRIDVVPVEVKGDLPTTLALGVETAGNIIGYPLEYSPRKWYITAVTGRLEDGTVIPEGRYRLVVRALRIFGDGARAEDYDTVETVPFELLYAK